jgi:hypothetical protein
MGKRTEKDKMKIEKGKPYAVITGDASRLVCDRKGDRNFEKQLRKAVI